MKEKEYMRIKKLVCMQNIDHYVFRSFVLKCSKSKKKKKKYRWLSHELLSMNDDDGDDADGTPGARVIKKHIYIKFTIHQRSLITRHKINLLNLSGETKRCPEAKWRMHQITRRWHTSECKGIYIRQLCRID